MIRFSLAVLPLGLLLSAAALPALAQQGPAPGLPTASPALQRPPAPGTPKGWALSIGIASVVAPVWQGSRDYGLSIFPDVRLNYRDVLFLSIPNGLGWNAVNQDGWKLGPLVKLRFGRREGRGGSPLLIAGSSAALNGMGDVGQAGEFGGFAQKTLAGGKLRLRAEVRQGAGGHDGVVANTLINWSDRVPGANLMWSAGIRATWADSAYSNTYFGVTPTQSAATGLPAFRTGSGLISAGITSSLTKPLGRAGSKGVLFLFSSYDRLGDVAADSPLIRLRGNRNQAAVGVGYGVRFGLGG